MAIYRQVQLSFWSDEKVLDEFTPEDKYFYLYLFTNPQTNLCGCYELGWTQTTSQLGYNKDTIYRLLDRFETVHKVIRYSKETKEVLILNWYKYNWQGGNQTPCIAKEIEKVKDAGFKQYLADLFEEKLDTEGAYKGLISPYQATVTVTDNINNNIYNNIYNNNNNIDSNSNSNIDTENKEHINTNRFNPPSVEEVRAYCSERKNGVDAENFVDFYSSKGWMIGKNKMKDWKAAVRTWERSRKGNDYGRNNDNRNNRNNTNTNSEISDAEERGYLQIEAGVSLSDLQRKWMGNIQS